VKTSHLQPIKIDAGTAQCSALFACSADAHVNALFDEIPFQFGQRS